MTGDRLGYRRACYLMRRRNFNREPQASARVQPLPETKTVIQIPGRLIRRMSNH